jgi:hypothetical protein
MSGLERLFTTRVARIGVVVVWLVLGLVRAAGGPAGSRLGG